MFDPAEIVLSGYLATDEVVTGANQELIPWSRYVPNKPLIRRLATDEQAIVHRRGAAIALFRRQVYRQLHVLLDPDERSKLLHPFGRSELEAMAVD